jgi:cytochrome c-type biogenesis protein CcmH/NrfG
MRKKIYRTGLGWAAAGAAALVITGCADQRPTWKVRQDADVAYEAKHYEAAKADYQIYVDRKPNDPTGQYALGRTYLALKDPKPAREHMQIAYDVVPNNDAYIEGYAQALYEAKEPETLMTFLNRVAAERGYVEDYLRLGRYAGKIGHPDEALQALTTAARLDAGKSLEPQLALADFYRSVNDRANEVKRLRNCLYLAPGDEALIKRIRDAGEIPGPSFMLRPEEAVANVEEPR